MGNDQLRRYNRVRSGQKVVGSINSAVVAATLLLIVLVSSAIAVVEATSNLKTRSQDIIVAVAIVLAAGGILLLGLLVALNIADCRWHHEWNGNEDLVIFSDSHAALRAARADGSIMTSCARMQLACFAGFLAIGGIAIANESTILACLVSLPLGMGLVNAWRCRRALHRITSRTL